MPDRETSAPASGQSADSLETMLIRRYGEAHRVRVAGNDMMEALVGHRSVRSYAPDPVPDEVVEALTAAAQSAATSSNLQLWTLVAVTDPERKARLNALAGEQKHIEQAPLLLVWLADLSRARRAAEIEDMASSGVDYLESFLTATVDVSLAAQNAAVALQSMGYGICYIGGMRNHPVEVAAELGLPPEVFAVFGMTVGRPAEGDTAQIKPRLPQTSILHRERYDGATFEADREPYDRVLSAFQESEGMRVVGWTSTVARRLSGPEKLSNRDKLKSYLRELGFKLR